MTGFEAYKEYLAVKNHFSLDSYDYIKYNGRISASEASFLKRKDKFFFTKLGRRFDRQDELRDFLVSNFLHNEKIWVGNLLDEKHLEVYKSWQKKQQSLSYVLRSDFSTILSFIDNHNVTFDTLFDMRDNELPLLLQLQQEDTIQVEEDDIFYPIVRKRIKKYEGFIDYDISKAKTLMKEIFT
jgi:hypothetical protein